MLNSLYRPVAVLVFAFCLSAGAAADVSSYKAGVLLIEKGQLQEAVNTLAPVAADTADIMADHAQFRLAQIFESTGDMDQAVVEYFKLAQRFPSSVYTGKGFYKVAEHFVTAGDYLRASEYFERVIALKLANAPKDTARYRAAQCYLKLGERDKAARYLAETVVFSPSGDHADRAYSQLRKLGRLDEVSSVRAEAGKSILKRAGRTSKVSDDSSVYLWDKGFDAYREGNGAEARQLFERSAREAESPRLAVKGMYWSAKAYERLGDTDSAIKTLKELADQYSYTYYGSRASERLGRPASTDIRVRTYEPEEAVNRTVHSQKYRQLMEASLFQEAAMEARQVIYEQGNATGRQKANIYLALALSSQQKYRPAINIIEGNFSVKDLNADGNFLSKTALNISYPKGYEETVRKFSEQFNVDPLLVFALIREESRFDPKALSRSRAHGLTQIMPRTGKLIARSLSIKPYTTSHLYSPGLNLKMGIYYLSNMLRIFDGNAFLALASYNGGPGNVTKWITRDRYSDIDEFVERIPLRETRNYVKKVLESYWQYKRLYGGG